MKNFICYCVHVYVAGFGKSGHMHVYICIYLCVLLFCLCMCTLIFLVCAITFYYERYSNEHMHSKKLMAAQHAFLWSSTSATRSVTILSVGTYLKYYTMYLLTAMLGLRWIKFHVCNFACAQTFLYYIVTRMKKTVYAACMFVYMCVHMFVCVRVKVFDISSIGTYLIVGNTRKQLLAS